MLWDLIRDFFVQHVFGGLTSQGLYYSGYIGHLINSDFDYGEGSVNDLYFSLGNVIYDNEFTSQNNVYISMGDWLSTTATIITITIIVVLCCLFVYKIIKLIGGLIR